LAPDRLDPAPEDKMLENWHLPRREGNWNPIIHTDLKLGNVVLSEAGDFYPHYKTPVIIDFGLAFNNGQYFNRDAKKVPGTKPVQFMRIGTPGSRPPVSFNLSCVIDTLLWLTLQTIGTIRPAP
jgi:serine/threonine protein kinase